MSEEVDLRHEIPERRLETISGATSRRRRARGHRLKSADLAGLHKECLAAAGADVIDVPLDYSDNEHTMSCEIKQLSAAIRAEALTDSV